ncbi:hypothetical protein BD324DRAFT_630043 [Kockovaella imperatae]|uniref:Fe2OG dioxygenase domain-containing protein n=1 Tax=Kockovaella imperatae TaxID=4999 RepID=A0A1Y1UEV3_9TREE|nr:hypothetical protein BD324DRAFT_630043 [Kockovaella imperatae]ORX36067.1 hypothetical protein BD324DRAFT_630043 [Kockovaella imperatae]
MVDASDAGPSTSYTAFRKTEKHFKNRSSQSRLPTLYACEASRAALDVSRPDRQEDDPVWQASWWGAEQQNVRRRFQRDKGKRPELSEVPREVRCGSKTGYVVSEGCILLPGYLDNEAQLDLLEAALSQYTLPPNPLSISTHYDLPPNLFEMYANESKELIPTLAPCAETPESTGKEKPAERWIGRKTVDTPAGHVVGYEEILSKNRQWTADPPSEKLGSKTAGELMKEMRWANLGWVYQWSVKSYDFRPDSPITFPPNLSTLCVEVVKSVPWDHVLSADSNVGHKAWVNDYVPDTGIVNFYQTNDTLMAHVDRAELDPSRPLVSVSLGHACVFLLGTSSRDDQPLPIILRSGDVLVMSGTGRQNYHGVPRIMEGTLPSHFEPSEKDSVALSAAKRWIHGGRININARQVFPPGFKRV